MSTDPHEIIAAVGLNRRRWHNGFAYVPYIKGTERWEGPDAISYEERGNYGRTQRVLICRHGDWKVACQACASRFYPPADGGPRFRWAPGDPEGPTE